jgi:thiol-disulfide isomerase/thioredoxin
MMDRDDDDLTPEERPPEQAIEQPRVRAPEIDRPTLEWFNVDKPLKLADLKGKLVILDFWTSCCINCMHVLPALKTVEAAYPDEVVVIGVHAPKFAAEQRPETLRAAIQRYGIQHPVANDVNFELWREYAVRAWPTLVFIGPEGHVMGQMSGEPDADRLLTAVSELVEQWDTQELLSPSPMPGREQPVPEGAFAFPGKIKPIPDGDATWALADAGHHQIVVLDDQGHELRRFGTGQAGFADGDGNRAAFRWPQGLCADAESIYVADTGNHAIRRIELASGRTITLAGTGERGMVVDDDEPSLAAALASPWDLEVDGDLVYIANAGTHQLLRLDVEARVLRPLAGNGGEDIVDGAALDAQLAQPSGLALDRRQQLLYFADSETSSVRVLSLANAEAATIVGEGLFEFGWENGPLSLARLQHPMGVALADGEVLVADSYNQKARVIDLAAKRVSDLDDGYACADDRCTPPAEPAGIWADGPDRVLLVDTNGHRVLEYLRTERMYRTWAGN